MSKTVRRRESKGDPFGPSPRKVSKKPSIRASVEIKYLSSSTEPSTDTSHTSSPNLENEALPFDSTLRPGFAQSFQGPVSVNNYLPRRSSLAFPSSPTRQRSTLGIASGNEQQGKQPGSEEEHNEKTCRCCMKMSDEIQTLKGEIAELRRLVKGKGRVD
jgi:hypothetical protein